MEPQAAPDDAESPPAGEAEQPAEARRRPLIERIGMALVALVMAALFAAVSLASFVGGELFLGVMGAVGCLMALWVGTLTLLRG